MGKTADLRRLAKAKLDMLPGETYYKNAPADAAFPCKTFTLRRVNLGDLSRFDYTMQVDVWDIADDPKQADEIADEMEDALNAANLPQETILPTFYREARYPVDDPDKSIQHVQLEFSVQLYTNE